MKKAPPSAFDHVTADVFASIRTLRIERGWTVSELTRRLADAGMQMDRSVIAKCENGLRQHLSVAELAAFAKVFEVPTWVLLREELPCRQCGGLPPKGFACLACDAGRPAVGEQDVNDGCATTVIPTTTKDGDHDQHPRDRPHRRPF